MGNKVKLPVGSGAAKRCAQSAAEVIPHPFAAHNPTRDAVANQCHMPSHRPPADQVVKRRYTVQIGNGKPQEV